MRPPQYEPPEALGNWLGGLRVIASQTQWYFSVPQFIAIMGLAYYEFALLQALPVIGRSIWTWIASMFAAGVLVLYLHYALVYPAMQIFQNGQSERRTRSPLYRRAVENGEQIQDIRDDIRDLKHELGVATTDGGVATEHTEDDAEDVEELPTVPEDPFQEPRRPSRDGWFLPGLGYVDPLPACLREWLNHRNKEGGES